MTGQTRERRPGSRTFWDDRATQYDAYFDQRGIDGHALRARQAATLRLVGPGPGAAPDAGMGPGRLCAALAARGWTVSGLDASPEMIVIARSRLPDAADRLVVGTIESLPFPDCSFDRVTATGVLEYTNVPAALSELARVLRPGGLAVVSYPNPRALYRLWKAWFYYPMIRGLLRLRPTRTSQTPRGADAISPTSFAALLQGMGLEPVCREQTSVMPIPAPLDVALPTLAAALARRLEGGSTLSSLLATQIVYAARKPA